MANIKTAVSLQKSLFEHQTKFARSQQKRVEALEALVQMFLLIEDDFNKMFSIALEFHNSSEEKEWEMDINAYKAYTSKIEDCQKHLKNNRL